MAHVICYGKHGFLNESGEVIVPCEYIEVKFIIKGIWSVRNAEGKWGVLADDGSVMVECKYDDIEEWYQQPRFFALKGDKYALIDYHGCELTNHLFDKRFNAGFVKQDKCCVCVDGKWGVIDTDGLFVIEPKYEFISQRNGYYDYKDEGKHGLLSSNGDVLLKNEFDYFGFSADPNLVVAHKNGNFGCLTLSGAEILPFEYSDISVCREADYIIVKKDAKLGLCNKNGKELTPCIYDEIDKLLCMPQFLVVRRIRKGWGLLAADGTELLPVEYQEISNLTFENGSRVGTPCIPISIKKRGKYGLYDPFERKIIEE